MAKRILFFRTGAIGDIIQCLPLLKRAKTENPDDSIELVIATPALRAVLVKYCPYIDKIYTVKKRINESKELMDSLKTNPVDDFIYLHTLWWRGWLMNFKDIKAKNFFQYKKDIRFKAVENFAITYFPQIAESLLAAKEKDNQSAWHGFLDYKTFDTSVNPDIKVLNDDKSVSEINYDKKYICIAVGVGKLRPTRAYPIEHWKKLIKNILLNSDYEIKLLGGSDEKKLAEYLLLSLKGSLINDCGRLKVDALISRVENLVAKTDLTGLAGILQGADHVFSADTGILHIAAALDCQITSIFSISSEDRTGAFHPRARVFRGDCPCKPDNSNSQKHCTNLVNGYASCLQKLVPERLLNILTDSGRKALI